MDKLIPGCTDDGYMCKLNQKVFMTSWAYKLQLHVFFISNVHSPYLVLWTLLLKTRLPCNLFCNYTKIQMFLIKFITMIHILNRKEKKN